MNPKTILLERLNEMREGLKERDGLLIAEVSEDIEKIRTQADREIEVLKLSRSTHTVREIVAALDRLDEGEYGICIACSENISPKRLAALPWAARCIRCQEQADLQDSQRFHNGAFPWSQDAAA